MNTQIHAPAHARPGARRAAKTLPIRLAIAILTASVHLAAPAARAEPILFDGTVGDVIVDDLGGVTATFSGGQVLFRGTNFLADHTGGLYASTSRLGGDYTNPITVTFSQPLTVISLLAFNAGPANVHIKTNDSAVNLVGSGGTRSISIGGDPVTSLTVSRTDENGVLQPEWDIGIFSINTSEGVINLDATPPPGPAGIDLETIARDGTPMPGGVNEFLAFVLAASLDDGTVVFQGADATPATQSGIYAGANGSLATVVDLTTAIPEGDGNFTGFPSAPSISGETVAFRGNGSNGQSGVYLASSGVVSKVADRNDAIPEGVGNFTAFDDVAVAGSDVAFFGAGSSSQSGIYTTLGGSLVKVADENTLMPDGVTTFLSFTQSAISGDRVVFQGLGRIDDGNGGFINLPGVFLFNGGTLSKIADTNTPAPGGGTFTGFDASPVLSGTDVYFVGEVGDESAIYVFSNGSLFELLSTGTAIPGGAFGFTGFPSLSVSGEAVAFQGLGLWQQNGIYRLHDGALTHVFSAHQAISGRVLTGPILQPFSFDGAEIGFASALGLAEGVTIGRGVFRATLPPVCGDDDAGGAEECDDGNTASGDGCSADCTLEDFCAQACAEPEALHLAASNAPLIGTDGDDTLCGDERNNVLRGRGGDDILCGFGGNDTLDGDDGNDRADGGEGRDVVLGSAGDDTLLGGAGNDKLSGHNGDDDLDGGEGDDALRGNSGDDLLLGGPGDDRLSGHASADELDGGLDDDTLRGGSGDDDLDGGDDFDRLNGDGGADACQNGEVVKKC